jgi:hypothetical protein
LENITDTSITGKQGIATLLNLSRQSRNNPVLYRIHSRAIRARLQKIMPVACGKAALLKEQITSSSVLPWSDALRSQEAVLERTRRMAEEIFPPLFDMKVGSDARFKDVADIFAAIDDKRKVTIEGLWTSISFNTGARLGSSIGISVLLGVVGHVPGLAVAAAWGLSSNFAMRFHREKAVLLELAVLLLVHDRLFWFGITEITREMAARAWIEVLKLLPDIDQTIQAQLSIFTSHDWEVLLLDIVEKFHHVDEQEVDGELETDA